MSNQELFFIGAASGFLAILTMMLVNALLADTLYQSAPEPAPALDPPGFSAMLREVLDITRGEPDDA